MRAPHHLEPRPPAWPPGETPELARPQRAPARSRPVSGAGVLPLARRAAAQRREWAWLREQVRASEWEPASPASARVSPAADSAVPPDEPRDLVWAACSPAWLPALPPAARGPVAELEPRAVLSGAEPAVAVDSELADPATVRSRVPRREGPEVPPASLLPALGAPRKVPPPRRRAPKPVLARVAASPFLELLLLAPLPPLAAGRASWAPQLPRVEPARRPRQPGHSGQKRSFLPEPQPEPGPPGFCSRAPDRASE